MVGTETAQGLIMKGSTTSEAFKPATEIYHRKLHALRMFFDSSWQRDFPIFGVIYILN